MITRRSFLQTSSLISLSPWIPGIFSGTAQAAEASKDAPVLVVIQLDGGNDGINTVVPYQDDAYANARSELRLKPDELHKLDDHVALHKEMKSAFELFNDGRLSIIHGVGYPNPNRSHFESMRIWQSGYRDEQRTNEDGWLGRALDLTVNPAADSLSADAIYTGEQELPLTLWGKRSNAVSVQRASDLSLDLEAFQDRSAKVASNDETLETFAARQVASAVTAASEFSKRTKSETANATKYPNNGLASQLKLISQLLQSDSGARVFYAIQSGYDTHSSQLNTHGRLLREFTTSLSAFLDDLRATKLDERVIVLAFSEFGRRVAENDSQGTDHGTAGPVFIAGSKINPGQIGHVPSLTDLVDGDLKTQIDFRQVYATILEKWFKLSSQRILGEKYEALPFLA